MKILIINDTSSSANWGARATSYALKKMISDTGHHDIKCLNQDEIIGTKRPDNSINRSKDFIKLLTPPILLDLKQKFSSNSNNLGRFQNIPGKWEDFDAIAENVVTGDSHLAKEVMMIKEADVVIIQGEGCIYGNTFHSRMLLFLGYLSKKYLHKPTLILNHTADFSHPELLKIAQNVYPLFDDIVFRESVSVQRSQSFCEARLGADAAFIFKPESSTAWLDAANRDTYFDFWPDTAHFDLSKPYICIGGGSGFPSLNGGRYNPVDTLSSLISYLQKKVPHQLVLTASGVTDLKIFRALETKFNLPLIGLGIPFQQAIDVLGNAAAYIGGRWHPSIFALSGGTPIIPFSSNSFKMKALSQMFGLSDNAFDPSNLHTNKKLIVNLLHDYLNQETSLRTDLQKRAHKQANRAFENVAYFEKVKAFV